MSIQEKTLNYLENYDVSTDRPFARLKINISEVTDDYFADKVAVGKEVASAVKKFFGNKLTSPMYYFGSHGRYYQTFVKV